MGLFNSGVNRGIRTLMEQSKDAGVGEQAIHNFMGRNGLKTVGGALSDAGGIVAGAGLAGGVLDGIVFDKYECRDCETTFD